MTAPPTVGQAQSGTGVATPRGSGSTTRSVAGRWPTQVLYVAAIVTGDSQFSFLYNPF